MNEWMNALLLPQDYLILDSVFFVLKVLSLCALIMCKEKGKKRKE